jgi:hypothetical protein
MGEDDDLDGDGRERFGGMGALERRDGNRIYK